MLQHIIGRDEEVAQLRRATHAARAGRGGVWLLAGEPGIGKSRLAEESERLAQEAGFACGWGRSWESGGAPAYWPWTQLLRALQPLAAERDLRDLSEPVIASLLRPADQAEGPLTADRFELFDAMAAALIAFGQRQPLWIGLEDLHAADAASLLLLESLCTPLRSARVLVVATLREAGEDSEAQHAIYRRIARQAHVLPLARLGPEASRALLLEAASTADETFVAAAIEATEGHPLFLLELARLCASVPAAQATALIPSGLQDAFCTRLDALTPEALGCLKRAAVFGLELDRDALAALFPPAEVDAMLKEGLASALLRRLAGRRYRFCHPLLRERLLSSLSPAEHASTHERIAAWLLRQQEVQPALLAHHLFAAGPSRLDEAVEHGLAAAEAALASLAFEDTERHLDQVAACPKVARDARLQLRIDLLRGRCLIGQGQAEVGRALCLEAAERASALGEAPLLAAAALAYGSLFRIGTVDPKLVALLERALAALPARDSPLRAHLLARLAAARQPDPDPGRPIALAHEAISMAERSGDLAARVATLRAGCSALVDLAHPRERRPLNERHLALAQQLRLLGDELQAHLRLLFDCMELGDFAAAEAHRAAAEKLAAAQPRALQHWRVPALRALRLLWVGDLREVPRQLQAVKQLGERSADSNAVICHTLQRARWVELAGAEVEVDAVADAMGRVFAGSRAGERLSAALEGAFLLRVGRVDEALGRISPDDVRAILTLGDRTLLLGAAQAAALRRDELAGRRLLELTTPDLELFVSDGVAGLLWRAPMQMVASYAALALGDLEAALSRATEAALSARRSGGSPAAAEANLLAAELARALGRGGLSVELRAQAEQLIAELGLHGLRGLERLAAAAVGNGTAALAPAVPAPIAGAPTFQDLGEMWSISWAGRTVQLTKVKGLAVIAHLVTRPCSFVHVIELAQLDGAAEVSRAGGVDHGDAGELLDAEARTAYRERARQLKDELREAEANVDRGRVEAIQRELAFISAELGRALGLGGRHRRAPAALERARQAVRKQVRGALTRIRAVHPELARHLEKSITTGKICTYDP